MARYLVIGSCGAGKTTFAHELSRSLGIPHVELDALHWEPNWTEAQPEVFRQRVEASTAGSGWVCDGNYSVVREILWPRATTVIWLDYSFPRVAWRLWTRTFKRSLGRTALWAGNRESLLKAFFSRDSILLWQVQTYWRRRRSYPDLLARPEFGHLRLERVATPREAARLLSRLSAREVASPARPPARVR